MTCERRMIRPACCLLLSVLLLGSCGRFNVGSLANLGGEKKKKEPSPFGSSGIPPMLRGSSGGGGGGTPISPGGNVPPGMGAAIPTGDDLIFTDPDNPDASLPELSTLLSAPKKGPWERSETVARQRAAREGKPLLIWFTDSSGSPLSKAMSDELFSSPEFESWASEKLIRLRVDSNERMSADDSRDLSLDEKLSKETDIRNYVAEMKKRYKILGAPVLVMLNPSGEVIAKYRGYKRGDADFTWGLLKQGEAAASTAYQSWRKDLEKKGYREWQDTKGRKVFAKLLNYNQGELVLMEPDGTRSKTQESRLSSADRDWISHQKMLRGIQ